MNHPHLGALFASVAALALALPACGGSNDGSANAPVGAAPPPPAPASVVISGVVADGPLQGATACYDLNDNGACDTGEPTSAATPADGSFTINVPTPNAGQHAVIVNVPATAIDQTTNAAIGSTLVFKAPATGANAADAAAYIQAQAGLAFSPLADFGGNTPGPQQAAMLAAPCA